MSGAGGREGGRAENGHISVQVQGSAVPVPSRLDGFSLSCAVAAAGAAMRAVLWDLLLLCLFARARGDCRGDCLRCDRHLYRDSFDVLVSPFCLLDCPPPGAAPMGVAPLGAVPTASPPYWVATLLPAPGLGFGVGGGLWLPVGMEPQGEGVTCRHCPSSLGTPQGRHRTRWS